jgi:tRNA A-37 threonylcarbamoyl transferase component Bud32/WD40 repeat protein
MSDRELFVAALALPEAERQPWLDQACADTDQRRRLDVLLRAHDLASRFLAEPAAAGPVHDRPTGSLDPASEDRHDEAADVLALLAPADRTGLLGKLDDYEVLEVVGTGGMGVVVKAFDPKLHRVVAIKLVAPHLAASASARRRFEREARAVAAVRDEHVVAIHQVEMAGSLPYLVMEFIGGVSLQDRLEQRGPLELKEILRIGAQAARGLAAAHAQGLVHRDIKPANILLENGVERVKITDFGLARAVDDVSLTRSGVITGTPNYMSPEQADGRPVDARSDLFSLGSVLYALATGHPPFRADGVASVLKRVAADDPRPVREINPDMPDWLDAIIRKLHAKDPAGRFQTASEVADLLGQHLAHLQQPAQVPMPAPVECASGKRQPVPITPVVSLYTLLLWCFTFGLPVVWLGLAAELCDDSTQPSILTILSAVLLPLCLVWFYWATRRRFAGALACLGIGLALLALFLAIYHSPALRAYFFSRPDATSGGIEERGVEENTGRLLVSKLDPDVEVFVERQGKQVARMLTGKSAHSIPLPAGVAHDLSIRKGPVEVHREVIRLAAGQKRTLSIPRIVLPERTVQLRPKVGSFPTDVPRMQLSPDHSGVAVERLDGPIIVFDTATGKERFTIARARSHSQAFGFTADGKRLAYLTEKDTGEHILRYVDAHTGSPAGKELRPKDGRFANARALAFSADGKWLVVSSAHNFGHDNRFGSRIHRWELSDADATEQPPLEWLNGTVTVLVFAPGRPLLAALTDTDTRTIWDLAEGKPRTHLGAGGVGDAAAWDSQRALLVASWHRDGPGLTRLALAEEERGWVRSLQVRLSSLAVGPRSLIAGGMRGGSATTPWEKRAGIRVWEERSGNEQAVLLGHTDWPLDLAFVPAGQQLVSAGKDGTVRWWAVP